MEAKEYQNLAMRTNDGKGTERLEKWIGEETGAEYKGDVMIENEIDAGGLLNGCLGLSGEAGELNDIVKKVDLPQEAAGSRTHEERNWRCLLVYRGYLPFDGLRPGRDLPDEY